MEIINYVSLAAAAVTFFLLLVAPRWGMPGLVLMFPLLDYAIPRAGPGLNAETVLYVAAALSLGLRARPALPPGRFLLPLIGFGVVVVLGAAINATSFSDPAGLGSQLWGLMLLVKTILWPALGFLIFFGLAPDEATRRRLLLCLSIALFVGGATSLIWPEDLVGAPHDRLTGILYGNPNQTGAFLAAFSLVPLTALFRPGVSRSLRLLSLTTYVVAVVTLAFTQSRGAWLAYLVGHAVWLLYQNRLLLVPAFAAVGLSAALLASSGLVPETVQERIEETLTPGHSQFRGSGATAGLDSSAQIRVTLYRMAGDMWVDSPIWGHGLRSFRLLASEYGTRYGVLQRTRSATGRGASAESLYGRVAVESGLIGLAVLAWIAWTLISVGRGLVRESPTERDVGVMFLGVLAAVGTNCTTMEALLSHAVAIPFWAVAGLATRAYYDHLVAGRAPANPPRSRAGLGAT